ncbi:hypothetical protein [Alishewanella longhuensis]
MATGVSQQQEDYKNQLQQKNTAIQLQQLALVQVQQQRQQLQHSIAELSAQQALLQARFAEQQLLQDDASRLISSSLLSNSIINNS